MRCAVGPKDKYTAGDYDYYLFDGEFRSYTDAEMDCAARYDGGHLATFNDESEYNAVTIWLQWIYAQEKGIWMGYTDAYTEGTFVSIDGMNRTLPRYIEWASGEPDNYHVGENCAMFRPSDRYLNDVSCYSRKNYVCKGEKRV